MPFKNKTQVLSGATLEKFVEETAWDKIYWSGIKHQADALKSDGCSWVPDRYIWTCWEHDLHYRTHKMLYGSPIDRSTADYIFRRRIQQGSGFGWLSLASWVRWAGVRLFGNRSWNAT